MLQLFIGAAVGAAAGYLYGSERGRDEARRRLQSAPEPVRRMTQTAAGAAGSGAQRAAEAVANAPLPEPVKGAAQRASTAVQAAARRTGEAAVGESRIVLPSETETATRPGEPLPRRSPEPRRRSSGGPTSKGA